MKVYEIKSAFEAIAVKLEAYEDMPEMLEAVRAELVAMEYERDEKVYNIGRWYKNLNLAIEAHASEIKVLQKRKKTLENKTAFLKELLAMLLEEDGVYRDYEDGALKISWRKDSDELIFDMDKVPEDLKRIKIEPRLDEMKKVIKEKGRQLWGDLKQSFKKNIWIR